MLAHLATATFVAKAENVILLGPPGIGKTHLAIGLGIKAAQAGHSVLFDTASNWITRLAAAHQAGALDAELKKIRRYKLIIIDEVGYIPFDTDAANLFFQLIASRYEQGSIIVTSNLPFGRWGEVFGDDVVAAAMIDRLVHHAEVLTLVRRLLPHPRPPRTPRQERQQVDDQVLKFHPSKPAQFSAAVDTSVYGPSSSARLA